MLCCIQIHVSETKIHGEDESFLTFHSRLFSCSNTAPYAIHVTQKKHVHNVEILSRKMVLLHLSEGTVNN